MMKVKLLVYIDIPLHFAGKRPSMRMTAILISLIGLVLSLQGALSSYCTVTEYSSPVSYYIKFTQQTNQNYDSWASVCTGEFFTRYPDMSFLQANCTHKILSTLFMKYFFSNFRLKLKLSKCYFS